MSEDIRNIEKDTIKNKKYRKVVHTIEDKFQLVLMCLNVGEDIPMETHKKVTQFIRVEKGYGLATINDKKYKLRDGSAVTIPPNTPHYIKNTSKTKPLKLYSIYVPPEHPKNRVNDRQPN